MSAWGPKPDPSFSARMSPSAECGHWSTRAVSQPCLDTHIVTGRAAAKGKRRDRFRAAQSPINDRGSWPVVSKGPETGDSGAPADFGRHAEAVMRAGD
jgi:hypothetical protein